MALTVKGDKFTRVYLLLWGIFLFAALLVFGLYKIGFRLTNHFEPVKVGSIELSSNETELQILVDNREKQVSVQNGAYNLQGITPGLHSIMVFKKGFWPWTKTVSTAENAITPVFAFIFPMEGLQTEPILSGSADYAGIHKNIRQNIAPQAKPGSLPLKDNESYTLWLSSNVPDRKISADGSTALFAENNTIYVAWISDTEPLPHYFCEGNPCNFKLPVTIVSEKIKSVDFYKNRRDVLIFAAGVAIYAIEVDHVGNQNFQPLYKGVDPYFYESPDGVLYIKDGNSLLKAKL